MRDSSNDPIAMLKQRAANYDKAINYLRATSPLTLEVLIEALRLADLREQEQATRMMWSMTPLKEDLRAELIRVLQTGKEAFGSL